MVLGSELKGVHILFSFSHLLPCPFSLSSELLCSVIFFSYGVDTVSTLSLAAASLTESEKTSSSLLEGWKIPRLFEALHSSHSRFQHLPAVLTLRGFKTVLLPLHSEAEIV